jgi:hypothetical protein
MPWRGEIRQTFRGVTRVYHPWYTDPPPERASAVAFFDGLSRWPWLGHKLDLPKHLDAMSVEEANAWLVNHPRPELYDTLVSSDRNAIRDDDLSRLEHLPEIERVHLWSDHLTDAGVVHLRHLHNLKSLGLYSRLVTDGCLDIIREMRTVRSLDLQLCPGISRRKWQALVKEMGIREYWFPWSVPKKRGWRFW